MTSNRLLNCMFHLDCLGRFGSVGGVRHDRPLGNPSAAGTYFRSRRHAFSWLRSYLHQRPSFVKTGTAKSSTVVGDTGVPQGSSLGPLLVSLFITPLGGVISRFAIPYHQYANDTQLYIAVD